jgi:hypothetical protein
MLYYFQQDDLTSSGKELPVSAGVKAPAEMPRSGNENIRFN